MALGALRRQGLAAAMLLKSLSYHQLRVIEMLDTEDIRNTISIASPRSRQCSNEMESDPRRSLGHDS